MDHDADRLEARLELDPRADILVGAIVGVDGGERRFSGWMELAAAIEAWRTGNRATAGGNASTAMSSGTPSPSPAADPDRTA